jgi:disulfide bond formation protein DsbB
MSTRILSLFDSAAGPAAALALSMLGALALQHILGWPPCPLCILQRLTATALLLSLGAAAFTRGNVRQAAIVTAGLATGAGLFFAGAQLWLLANPTAGSCGPGLALTMSQLAEAIPGSAWLLEGAGACDDARHVVLGLPLAFWSGAVHLLAFSWAVRNAQR